MLVYANWDVFYLLRWDECLRTWFMNKFPFETSIVMLAYVAQHVYWPRERGFFLCLHRFTIMYWPRERGCATAKRTFLSSFWNERQGETVREGSEQCNDQFGEFLHRPGGFVPNSHALNFEAIPTVYWSVTRSVWKSLAVLGITYNTCMLTLPGLWNRNTSTMLVFWPWCRIAVRWLLGLQINCVHQKRSVLVAGGLCFIIRSQEANALSGI